MQSATINPTTFNCPLKEWKFSQFEVNLLEGMDWMKCPSCSINRHSCHVDGNMKLHHYHSFGRYVIDKLKFRIKTVAG